MKTFSALACLLLAGALLTNYACDEDKPGVRVKPPEAQGNTVSIHNCVATPDWIAVYDGQPLTWRVFNTGGGAADDHTYVVKFGNRKPVLNATPQVGANNPSVQVVHKDATCAGDPNQCKFPYDLIQKRFLIGDKVCPDPGVHIIGGP